MLVYIYTIDYVNLFKKINEKCTVKSNHVKIQHNEIAASEYHNEL